MIDRRDRILPNQRFLRHFRAEARGPMSRWVS